MAGLCMYRFAPSDLLTIFSDAEKSRLFLVEGGIVLAALIALRVFGFCAGALIKNRSQAIDTFVIHSTPAIFLWIVFVSENPSYAYLGFWGCIFFFLGIWLDERLLTVSAARTSEYASIKTVHSKKDFNS